MTKIIMHGCNGAMGQTITKIVEETQDVEIVAVNGQIIQREN